MKRGIVIYLENKPELILQFGCLYTSWKFINAKNTDLIVFGPKDVLSLLPNDCVKVEYNSINVRYPYINSISCLTDHRSNFICKYDYILRTDVDTFLTPSWNSFSANKFVVGRGRYANDDSVKYNIKKIAQRFGLNHQGIHNIGSTHYGPPHLIRNVCKLSTLLSNHILTNEFTDSQGMWPGWYEGVTSMYSNEIAVNHLIDHLMIAPSKLDFESSSHASILHHPHIHCWHTNKAFSKFSFFQGKYNNIPLNSLDINKIDDYCTYVALLAREEVDLMKSLLNPFD
jgi:hypothetical protein